jgi:hypothetical protein
MFCAFCGLQKAVSRPPHSKTLRVFRSIFYLQSSILVAQAVLCALAVQFFLAPWRFTFELDQGSVSRY